MKQKHKMVPCLLEAEDESVDAAAAAVKDTACCWMEVDLEDAQESTDDDCTECWDA